MYKFNLQAIAIGNGWTDPAQQYAGYTEFAASVGVNKLVVDGLWAAYETCHLALVTLGNNPLALTDCMIYLEAGLSAISAHMGYNVNVYNVFQKCGPFPLCYNMTSETEVLNMRSVQQSLGVNKPWETCDGTVHEMLTNDWLTNVRSDLPAVLKKGIRVTFYSGVNDYICNHFGTRDLLNSFPWTGAAQWKTAKTASLPYGSVKSVTVGNEHLEFVKIK